MTLTQYFQVVHPEYVILKLTPDTSIRNYNSSNIARAIQFMYRSIVDRIHYQEKHFIYETPLKCSFFIDIQKQNVIFYFIVPEHYFNLIKEKIIETWPKVTIEKIESIKPFTDAAVKYQLSYSKEDALSLNLNKKCNEPLNSILNVLDVMQEGDRIGIFYNFMPCNQLGWRKQYNDTIEKIKHNLPTEREKFTWSYILKEALIIVLDFIQNAFNTLNDFVGNPEIKKNNSLAEVALMSLLVEDKKKLSSATVSKQDNIIINTQMIVVSDGPDKKRRENNAISILESYKTISEDNELKYKKLHNKNTFQVTDYKVVNAEENKLSVDECQNLLELPGRELLNRYSFVSKIDVLENSLPVELRKGIMCTGENTFKGFKQKAYLSSDENYKNLTLCLIGPTRAGKTALIENLSRDAVNSGECTILFDFCGNCGLSDDVSKVIKNVLNIDCSNYEKLQGLGYNEIKPINDNIFEIYRCAKTKTSQLMTFINSINSDDSELKVRMERYLEAAAVVVFIQSGNIKNVFEVLQDYKIRGSFIKQVPEESKTYLQDYINALNELDEWSKETKDNPSTIIGTKDSLIQGILNRVSKLKQNTYMELMLKKNCNENFDLVEEIQKPQLICIRMPEIMFSTEQEKDIYCTYWLTKIWGALQVRMWNIPPEKRTKVNIIFDELYQVPNCQDFLRSKLSQIAKFNCKIIISCHYLGQIDIIRNELKAANSSYMLISGCDKDNFKELKEELDPYQLEDLLNLKRYHSLNLLRYEGGWAKFITKLPPPIKP